MRHNMKRAAMAIALSASVVMGSAAIAHAATSSPSKATGRATPSASSTSNSSTIHHCPND